MVQRFLFNRIDAKPGSAIRSQYDLIIDPPANKTQATLPFMQFAGAWTNIALNTPIVAEMPITRRYSVRAIGTSWLCLLIQTGLVIVGTHDDLALPDRILLRY